MMYEISRESFKQRLEQKLNFKMIHIYNAEKKPTAQVFKDTLEMLWTKDFSQHLTEKFTNKADNILFFSLEDDAVEAKRAAEIAASLGYQFVYFYQGTQQDLLLDQGLN